MAKAQKRTERLFKMTAKIKEVGSILEVNLWDSFFSALYNENPHLANSVQDVIASYGKLSNDDIQCVGKLVFMGPRSLDLGRSRLLHRLYKFFIKKHPKPILKDDLICYVYEITSLKEVSARRYRSLCHNLVKLISRARREALTHLENEGEAKFEWFVYDCTHRSWIFRVKKC